MRKLVEKTLVLATHNKGKLIEISELLKPFDLKVKSVSEFGLPEPKETEDSFKGNARIKALYAAEQTGFPALSDDSGIEIAALDGAPGVYTADWAETDNGRNFNFAMSKTHQMLVDKNAEQPWKAQFMCTLCLTWPDGYSEYFIGKAKGTLTWPIRGSNGFGYDPMFIPEGYNQTFGEMLPSEKEIISHRTKAFKKFVTVALDG